MKTLVLDEAKIQYPAKCPDCGDVPGTPEIIHEVTGSWNRTNRPCSICGEPFKVVSGVWKHYHKLNGTKEDKWSMGGWPDYEPYWEWLHSFPEGRVNIRVHVSCAKKVMPFADFKQDKYETLPARIPKGGMPKEVHRTYCEKCKVEPGPKDNKAVIARLYSTGHSCVYCGEAIKLVYVQVSHRAPTGDHRRRWCFRDWRWEPQIIWCGYRMDAPGYNPLWFYGHLRCTAKAMPHLEWLEKTPHRFGEL